MRQQYALSRYSSKTPVHLEYNISQEYPASMRKFAKKGKQIL